MIGFPFVENNILVYILYFLVYGLYMGFLQSLIKTLPYQKEQQARDEHKQDEEKKRLLK